jgi:hypothetical protein
MAAWAVMCLLRPIARIRMAPAVAGIILPTLTASVPKTQQSLLRKRVRIASLASSCAPFGDQGVLSDAGHDGQGEHALDLRRV